MGLIGSEVQIYPNMPKIYQKAIAVANTPSLAQLGSPSRASHQLASPTTLGMALCSALVATAVCVVTVPREEAGRKPAGTSRNVHSGNLRSCWDQQVGTLTPPWG